MRNSLAVIILTWNEELNLKRCLESIVGLANEIFVVDCYSTDKTLKIAEEYGAIIAQHPFRNQAEQFNWALDNLDVKSDWILKLDADEYLTGGLKKEITEVLSGRTSDVREIGGNVRTSDVQNINGFYIKRRVCFLGKWIKHGGYYPIWFLRLWRRGKGRSENRKMDEHIVLLEGESEMLKNDFVDDNRNGLGAWIEKHKKYAAREAEDILAGNYGGGGKRSAYYKLPPFLRVFAYFTYRYFFKLGFLDGWRGMIFHFLHGFWYRFLVDAKIYGLSKR